MSRGLGDVYKRQEYKLAQTDSEAKRKQIIKKEYKELMHTFKQPLMKLTVTQGKILVRLIYRETNNTSFNHIKEYKEISM